MAHVSVDFQKGNGKIKPMHAVNNGPVGSTKEYEAGIASGTRKRSNIDDFRDAGIPYARTHDASFCPLYGAEHTVDVYYVFPNFDADPTDPANYDFVCTDEYLKGMQLADVKCFYRLGHRIEHEIKKYGTMPPKDFQKWAVICEHIIRHYNEGWADGYRMDIEYWEIWNEPDLHWNEAPEKRPTWGGTKEQFFELYHVAATHLKKCFPHLKIGGPALAGNWEWAEEFLAQLKAPLDFFSWHCYGHTVEKYLQKAKIADALLKKYGFENTESILNEWNYVLGWRGDDIVYSYRIIQGHIKGAAFVSAVMLASQNSSIDMLMYYDARNSTVWNGMFGGILKPILKGYYPFYMFNVLYQLGTSVEVTSDSVNGFACAAVGENEAAVMVTHFNDDDTAGEEIFSIDLLGFGGENGAELEYFVLDENHDLTPCGKISYVGERLTLELPTPNFTSYLIRIKRK